MTKDEAIKAMSNGEKVTHRHFTPDEWIRETEGKIEFEDGCRCEFREFWTWRDGGSWDSGWRIYV